MKQVAIWFDDEVSKHDAIIECARSISEGYGAGTIAKEEYGDVEFLGSWTSIPRPEDQPDLIIDIPEDMQDDQYLVAGIVRRKAKEYEEN